jgi:hypothetical protein
MSANQPIPLLYSGTAGNYFGTECEGLPESVHPTVGEVGQLLSDRGLTYLGQLTCSQFANVAVYAYATGDRCVAVSVMASESGLQGIDCVSRFADESFLTTTTVGILPGAYDEQQLFRVSFPELNATELLTQHLAGVRDFEQRRGMATAGLGNLLAIAQLVDEYTSRQQSNDGHGVFEALGVCAQAGMAEAMQVLSNDQSDDDDGSILDRIEYDESAATPLVQAILQDDLVAVEQFLSEGVELNPQGWDGQIPLVAAVFRGNANLIQRLITAGADVDKLDFEINARPLGTARCWSLTRRRRYGTNGVGGCSRKERRGDRPNAIGCRCGSEFRHGR